ncbi:MAG: 16S rRNA (cytosine(967)-C(5))-methyltransferase RsmB [Rhodocyclaceae bacterium]|nr:16S rRNA (cytosine(967)-C(5))-methyltransferase RsmB [Rhodocyclaceae bacterium]
MTNSRNTPRRNTRHAPPPPSPTSLAGALCLCARLISQVRTGRSLTQAFSDLAKAGEPAYLAQRPAIQDIVYGALREHALGPVILRPLLRAEPPEPVYSLLLATRHRLDTRPEQAHTIVDQAVDAAASMHHGRLSGLVNGVLRGYLRRRTALHQLAAQDPEAHHQHPAWWIDTVRREQPAGWRDILRADNDRPPMALRINRRRTGLPSMLEALSDRGIGASALTSEAILLDQPCPVGDVPGFAEGACSVQDPGAQQAAHLLDLAPGQQVLDACAAPGGKTAHILELSDVSLLALEQSPQRMTRVTENLARLGLAADQRVADCRALAEWWDGRPFDRILADVPCSASGVVRRHPDIKWLRRREDIQGFARQQAEILDRLWQTLAPGGKMLYVTCSVFAQENDLQAENFCRQHGDARRLPIDGQPHRQLLPCAQHDGFFFALFAKHA